MIIHHSGKSLSAKGQIQKSAIHFNISHSLVRTASRDDQTHVTYYRASAVFGVAIFIFYNDHGSLHMILHKLALNDPIWLKC